MWTVRSVCACGRASVCGVYVNAVWGGVCIQGIRCIVDWYEA